MREESAAAIKIFSLEIDFLLTHHIGSKRKRKKVAPKKKKKTDRVMVGDPVGRDSGQELLWRVAEYQVKYPAVGRVNFPCVKFDVDIRHGVSAVAQSSRYGLLRDVKVCCHRGPRMTRPIR